MRARMNVVVTNLKGGVGKTTTAVYLSAAAAETGYDPVVLIDTDRQASSAEWLEERPLEGVTIVEAPSERTLARAMSKNEGLRIVDTPPGDERLVQTAVNAADDGKWSWASAGYDTWPSADLYCPNGSTTDPTAYDRAGQGALQ